MPKATAKILVVEDDAFIALDVKTALESAGYYVIGPVGTGEGAIEACANELPHLVLMDISLEGKMDGIQTASKIHSLAPIPVVFLSGLTDEATLQRARLVGPFGYMIKPFDEVELTTTVQLALDRAGDTSEEDSVTSDEKEREDGGGKSSLDDSQMIDESGVFGDCALLATLPPRERATLEACGEVKTVEGGTVLQNEDENAANAFIVLTGRISVKKTTAGGKELILALLGPGDCFGLLPLLPTYSIIATARAQLDSKVFMIHRSSFATLRTDTPILQSLICEEALNRLQVSYDLNMSLAHSRVESRILAALSTLSETMSKRGRSADEARIFITRKELADLTGTTPETAIRVTKQLERNGVLDLTRPGVIKIPSLERLFALIE